MEIQEQISYLIAAYQAGDPAFRAKLRELSKAHEIHGEVFSEVHSPTKEANEGYFVAVKQ